MRSRQLLLALGVVVLLSFCTGTAFGATVTEGPWTLYRGSSIVQPRVDYPSLAACAAAADRLTPRTYTCRTIATVVVEATPVPVNCAVSAWSDWSGGAWGACSNGSQSRTETRSRTITTQSSNGGQACPVLTETRTVTQPCSSPPPPASVTGSYEAGPLSVALTGTFARYPGDAVAPFGSLTGTSYTNDPRTVNGSRSGIYTTGAFSLTVNCPQPCSVRLYVGGWNSAGRITAGGYTHTTSQVSGQWNAVYTLNLPGSTSVSWARSAGVGNVTIQAAELVGPAPPLPTGMATLEWTAPAAYANGEPIDRPLNYRVEYGQGDFARTQEVAQPTAVVSALESGEWQFRVRASAGGVFGEPSDTGTKTIP